jgi:hypothetical protein
MFIHIVDSESLQCGKQLARGKRIYLANVGGLGERVRQQVDEIFDLLQTRTVL